MKWSKSSTIIAVVGTALLYTSTVVAQAAPPSANGESLRFRAYVTQGEKLKEFGAALESGRPVPLGEPLDEAKARSVVRGNGGIAPPKRQMPTPTTMQPAENPVPLPDPLASPITETECLQQPAATYGTGWIKHHFGWCERWGFAVPVIDQFGAEVGRLSGEVMIVTKGSSGASANARFDWRFRNLRAEGVVSREPGRFGIENWLHAEPVNPPLPLSACGEPRWVGRRTTVENWLPNPTTYWWTYGDVNGTAPDGKSACRFVPYFRFYEVSDPGNYTSVAPWFRIQNPYANGNALRCDHATYIKIAQINRPHGCIFNYVYAYVFYSASNTNHYEATRHIYDSLNYPVERTKPTFAGKTIPGHYGNPNDQLHRNWYDNTLKSRSRTRVVQECKKWWPNYVAEGKDCDEYPFNSTYEAAGKGDNRFSARAIPLGQNRSGGSWLGYWYVYDRILDGDGYWVTVIA